MQERVKVFNFISGHGETVIESRLEDQVNQWLAELRGNVLRISQSESARAGGGHHITICVWYELRS